MSVPDLLRDLANRIAYVWAAAGLLALILFLARQRVRSRYRRWSRATARRLVRQHGVKLNRFHLAQRLLAKQKILEAPEIVAEAKKKSLEQGLDLSTVMDEVDCYLDEMIPSFNVISYYQWGHWAARASLNVLYQVHVNNISAEHGDQKPDRHVVYVMNHRSNADYVLVAFALFGQVSISYAVGEWARVWPLEYLFKSFGSYFIRRGFRDALYHTVLKCYVQELTRQSVTQGIFIEGGLSRDGLLRAPKLGLLDYITGVIRDPDFLGDIVFMPVGINYDRVLEDRALLLEADGRAANVSRLRRFRETLGFALKGAWRTSKGRRAHFGAAAVQFGEPLSLREFVNNGANALELKEFDARRDSLQGLSRELMRRIGRAVPVTPVSFAAAALLTHGGRIQERDIASISPELRDRFEINGALVLGPLDGEDLLSRGLRTLAGRGIVTQEKEAFRLVEKDRSLVEYYRNAVAQFGI